MNLRVIDYIREANDGRIIPRTVDDVKHVIIHRAGLSIARTPDKLIEAFQDTREFAAGSFTGGQIPYTFLITTDGRVYQLLHVDDVGWHARRWSLTGIGVAVAGDFRNHEPTEEQWDSLLELSALLCYWIGPGYQLAGHTELPLATNIAGKECPGSHLDMAELREQVKDRVLGTKVLDKLAKKLVLLNYGLVI